MSFQHHSEGMSDDLRSIFEKDKEARKRFSEQVSGRAKRTFSDGRIGPEDDGDLAFAIGPHPQKDLIVMDFGKDVTFIAMSPHQAVELAQCLIKHARAMSKEPLRIALH